MVTRRGFLFAAATVSGAAVLAAGCSDSPADPGPDAAQADRCGTEIEGNHGHELVITTDDAAAGAAAREPTTLHIQGASSHDHLVTLTPADFERLLAGEAVRVTSSLALAHTHVVTLDC